MRSCNVATRAILGLLLVLNACSGDPESEGLKDEGADDGKTDAWDYRNDPDRFRQTFNYRLAELPLSGEAEQTPWPDWYWPYYRDSINYRWNNGALSPAELYDLAFNDWTMPEGFMDLTPQDGDQSEWDAEYYTQIGPLASAVHRQRGNLNATNGRDDDDDGRIDETDDYDGIETWWGVCHAWTPAAIMEPEPNEPVTYNDQVFYPSDLKALMMIAYDSCDAHMLGGRCNDKEVSRDENGRSTDSECQDVNAGAFHVVITNMLGIHRRAFAEDRTYDYQVWNQPIRSYEITALNEGLTAAEAMTILGQTSDRYTYNDEAVSFAEVRMSVRYITESHPETRPLVPEVQRYTRTDRYHYVLELDTEGNIIGGEWGPNSQRNHPDFLWLPTGPGTSFYSISYANVRMLVDMARSGGSVGEGEVFETSPALDIPDNDPTGVTSTLNVPTSGIINSLQVRVDISHTYVGDLTVSLTRNGETVTLQSGQGGSSNDLVTSFPVTNFNGEDIEGDWQLTVVDGAGQDVGVLNTWGLNAILDGGSSNEPQTYSSTEAVAIPDNDPNGASSIINVNDEGTVRSLSVRVNIEHTFQGDLLVELRHAGAARVLHNRTGGATDNIEQEFQVTEFNGASISGTWELFVSDNARHDTGRIMSFTLVAELD